MANTPNYNFELPTVNGDADTWGTKNNQNWSDIDTDLKAVSDVANGAAAGVSAALQKANNLSDLPSASTARTNLGLGTAATQPSSSFDAAGAASAAQSAAIAASCQRASNLSDVANAATARTNLGLGSLATSSNTNALNAGSNALGNVTISTSAPSGTPANGDRWLVYVP